MAATTSASAYAITQPHGLRQHARDVIVAHLGFSAGLASICQRCDALMDAIYAALRTSRRRRLSPCYRFIVRTLRRLDKFQDLRSSLEGLVFEQLDAPERNEQFLLEGREHAIGIMHIYFSRHTWRQSEANVRVHLDRVWVSDSAASSGGGSDADDEAQSTEEDVEDQVTEGDNAQMLCMFMDMQRLLDGIREHVDTWVQEGRGAGTRASVLSDACLESLEHELSRVEHLVSDLVSYLMRLLERQLAAG